MYVIVSITLSSMILVIIRSKTNSVVICSKPLVTSVVDNVLMD